MRLSAILSVVGAAAMVAADGAAVVSVIKKITADAVTLNKSVTAFQSSNLLSLIPVYIQSDALVKDINNGTAVANASAPFSIEEALNLIPPTQTLVNTTISTLNNLKSRKPDFDKTPFTSLVLDQLKTQQKAAGAFSNATIAKVPFFAQDLARSYLTPLDAAFSDAIKVFSTPAKSGFPFGFKREAEIVA